MTRVEKAEGCLIGGGVGDALGYAVEFMSYRTIVDRFGAAGITKYGVCGGQALVSDDTQMTLFTAAGLIDAETLDGEEAEGAWVSAVSRGYAAWYRTQTEPYPAARGAWAESPAIARLMEDRALFAWRAPGTTCLSALRTRDGRAVSEILAHPINNSKGCGGVMRVAPVGFFISSERGSDVACARLAAELAALTHGHPLGYIPAAALAVLIRRIVYFGESIRAALPAMQAALAELFGDEPQLKVFTALVDKACALAADRSGKSDEENIRALGGGWVAEETLAIALYCALKYADDFEKAVVASVNHNGDSDSTGAVTGNLMGAVLGRTAIPAHFREPLELKAHLTDLATRLVEL